MTVALLKEFLESYEVPDDAVIFVEADHGQDKERAGSILVSRSVLEDGEYTDPDSLIFEWDEYEECYDEDCLEEYDPDGPITAVLISY